MDVEKTLQWLREKVTPILTEARQGNTWRASALPIPLRFYMDNVLATRTVDETTFQYQYPQLLEAADQMRVAEEHDAQLQEQVAALPAMQTTIDSMAQQIADLTAQIASLVAASQPKLRKPKVAPVTEPEPEGDTPPAAPSGEGDNPESDGESGVHVA